MSFLLLILRHLFSTLFPYTTLFRSISVRNSWPRNSADRICPLHLEVAFSLLRMNLDRKSTRLNSSHITISYAVFCLKKKTQCRLLNEVLYSSVASRRMSLWCTCRHP